MIDKTYQSSHQVQAIVDAKGLRCPEPLMQLYAALNKRQNGECVRFIANDPASWRDVHTMCDFLSHHVIDAKRDGDCVDIIIQKRN